MATQAPRNVIFAEDALLVPLSVVIYGVKFAGLSLGCGIDSCMRCKPHRSDCSTCLRCPFYHSERSRASRLAFAKDFVPSCITYEVDRTKDLKGNAEAIHALFGSGEYVATETILECTGVESSVYTAAYTARRGGTVIAIGVAIAIMKNLPFMHTSLAEVSCTGVPVQ